MKSLNILSTPGTPPTDLLIEPPGPARVASSIPVSKALAAIGQPESLSELAQRLVTTVSMLWSDIERADLFVPYGGSGELRGVCNPLEGHVLLSAVATSYDGEPTLKVVPVTPSLVVGDRGVGC